MTQNTQLTPKDIRQAFLNWYEKAKKHRLPLYVPAQEKKALVLQFEKATGIKYTL